MKIGMKVSSMTIRNSFGFWISRGNNDKPDNWICYGYKNDIYVSKKSCLKHSRFLGSVCSMKIGDIV